MSDVPSGQEAESEGAEDSTALTHRASRSISTIVVSRCPTFRAGRRSILKMQSFIDQANAFGAERAPFYFLIDFEKKDAGLFHEEDGSEPEIFFDINKNRNFTVCNYKHSDPAELSKILPGFENYREAFENIRQEFILGNTYLLNLTGRTEIKTSLDMREIFCRADAPYKVWKPGEWVVFSPECFIRIEGSMIKTMPMKGTISAGLPGAEEILIQDEKELAEHVTVVDLLRNDLSQVAAGVKVESFRDLTKVTTRESGIWQTSSLISGRLEDNWQSRIGDILDQLTPAGSVSGAPKEKTLEIIRREEKIERGYYTGIAGYFDGQSLDSGVLIRFIEKADDILYYRSGGGITVYSDVLKEYQEMADKVYVPFS
jgi:para-aminobenzoate synthetase component I